VACRGLSDRNQRLGLADLPGQFIGWGALPYFSEFSPPGQLEFNAQFPAR
jgi:hypothetical protein